MDIYNLQTATRGHVIKKRKVIVNLFKAISLLSFHKHLKPTTANIRHRRYDISTMITRKIQEQCKNSISKMYTKSIIVICLLHKLVLYNV